MRYIIFIHLHMLHDLLDFVVVTLARVRARVVLEVSIFATVVSDGELLGPRAP